MPPLYGEEQSSGQAQQAASLQTHSSKFPVSAITHVNHEITGTITFVNHFLAMICDISPKIIIATFCQIFFNDLIYFYLSFFFLFLLFFIFSNN